MSENKYPERAADVPVTQKMLYGIRDELREEIKASSESLKSDLQRLKGELKSDLHDLKSDMHEVKANTHRFMILMEEQNARNIIVMDGLTSLFARQDRIEKEFESLKS